LSTASTRIHISPFSFRRTFALQAFGAYDPTATLSNRHLSKSFATASGPCTVTIEAVEGGVQIACNGAEAEENLEELMRSFRADDGHDSFLPEHPLLRRLRNEQRGLRLLRVPWLFDIACSAVLQQRVKSTVAMRDWSRICSKFGGRPSQGRPVFPSPTVLASIPLHELQGLGVVRFTLCRFSSMGLSGWRLYPTTA
jgi:3-methyladenine DNA glycosylase/8-oxoguanine DNA glycosylase